MPVLDGQTNVDDGLSDARSLAASMRGGGSEEDEEKLNDVEVESFSRQGSLKRNSVLTQVKNRRQENRLYVKERVVFNIFV